jgi:hypothetical protein
MPPFELVIGEEPAAKPAPKARAKVVSFKSKNGKTETLKNGRDRLKIGEGFSRITTDMQRSEAFQSLSASAVRVLLWSLWLNYNTATTRSEGKTEKPRFKFTNAEASEKLSMGSAKFSRAKEELSEKGFLSWVKRGGLKGCNGVCSEYMLSGDWKTWKPTTKNKRAPPRKNRCQVPHMEQEAIPCVLQVG